MQPDRELWYGLDGEPISVEQAEPLLASPERVIAKTFLTTDLGRVEVSTVFLVLDHSFGDDGPPVLWETMTFGGPEDLECRRYRSREDAVAGHDEEVMACRMALELAGASVLAVEQVAPHAGTPEG